MKQFERVDTRLRHGQAATVRAVRSIAQGMGANRERTARARGQPMNDEIVNRLFEVTEQYECLLRAVKEHPSSTAILDRAEEIRRERGLLKDGEDGRC